VNCQFCHGADAKGGDGAGPNLIRSQLVLEDKAGENMTALIRNGRGDMPTFPLTDQQTVDVAAFIHNFPVGSRGRGSAPLNILVGKVSVRRISTRSVRPVIRSAVT
jgi:mono/diheme cytochrome c family protein